MVSVLEHFQRLKHIIRIKAARVIDVHVGEMNGSVAIYEKRGWNRQLSLAACIFNCMTELAIQFNEVITQLKHNPKTGEA